MDLKETSGFIPARRIGGGSLYAVMLHTAGWIWICLAGFLAIPLGVSFIWPGANLAGHMPESASIGYALALALVMGIIATLATRDTLAGARISASDSAVIAAFCWISVGLFSALPYYLTGQIPGFMNCYFETISGFTTTGASVVPDPATLTTAIQLWRGMTQWLGGMGIIALFVAALPAIGESSHNLFQSEVPGGTNFKKVTPRIRSTAQAMWIIYIAFTIVETILLWAFGWPFFDSLIHSFATVSTGGFSTFSTSFSQAPSVACLWIAIIFMALSGANFTLHFRLARGEGLAAYHSSAEFKVYIAIIAVAGSMLTLDLLFLEPKVEYGPLAALSHGFFQATTIMTTTGFMSDDFGQWSQFGQAILFILMFIGGCAGSTSGAIKVIRNILIFKAIEGELRRMLNPRKVSAMRLDKEVIDQRLGENALVFAALFVAVFAIGGLLLTMMGMDMVSAFSASVSCLGNVGPGLGSVGPATTYLDVPTAGKALLILEMLLGRLELFGLILFVMVITASEK